MKALRVFIAEGAPPVSERLVELIMSLQGATIVGEAHRTTDALRMIRNSKPDVVLLDLDLQGNGLSLLSKLKAEMPKIGIIVLSNNPDKFTERICLQRGADLFLDKSREITRLLRVLTSWKFHRASRGVAS
jgi:two-component system response regulator EvgA